MKTKKFLAPLLASVLLNTACRDDIPTEPTGATTSYPFAYPPSLLSPAEGAVMDNGCFDPRDMSATDMYVWDFDWTDPPSAEYYHLYVIGPNATLPMIDNDLLESSSATHAAFGYIVTRNAYGWRWKVRAGTRGLWTEWSPEGRFDVEPVNTDCTDTPPITSTVPPDMPIQLSPRNGAVFHHYPRRTTLKWTAVPGAVSYGLDIEVHWRQSWNPGYANSATTTEYTFDFVGAQPGRWRVWAVLADREGPKTGWWYFAYTV